MTSDHSTAEPFVRGNDRLNRMLADPETARRVAVIRAGMDAVDAESRKKMALTRPLPAGAAKPPAGAVRQENDDESGYDAIWAVPTFPKPFSRDDGMVVIGAAVHLNSGWDFFDAEEPAYVYGRAGRMGASSGVMIRKAAVRGQVLEGTGDQFRQLYLGDHIKRSPENDAYYIQRFAAGLQEHSPFSSHWWPARRPPAARTW
ncbi:hypothetical protein ABLG96_20630 [Nakamurella sp. A5-74]|uniref:Uncharacterized protein n=1 Tax=Nakamurella sp. A5-74 TaxID=3158264 RepID=A0AAU8DN07_9ACTN